VRRERVERGERDGRENEKKLLFLFPLFLELEDID